LKCIDDSIDSQLGFRVADAAEVKYVDNTPTLSARSYAILCVNKKMSLDEQAGLVKEMNGYIKRQRDAYNSLFRQFRRRSEEKATFWRLTFVITFFRGRVGGECNHEIER
jgi:hypothetical protein